MHWKKFDYGKWQKEDQKFDHETYDKKLEEAHERSTDFLEFMESVKKLERPPFKPNAIHNEDGDMIEVYLSDETISYKKWLCPQISLLLCQETDEIIGVNIHGVKRLLEKDGDE